MKTVNDIRSEFFRKYNMICEGWCAAHILNKEKSGLLLEAMSLTDVHAKYYSDIPEEDFRRIIEADPTSNPNKMDYYSKWLLNISAYNGGDMKMEDLYKANKYLFVFNKFKSKIEKKDINQYKSLPDLYDAVEPFLDGNQYATKSEELRAKKLEGAEKVYEDDRWLVIVPKTEDAAILYGKGTQWCTAAEKSHNYFEYYNKNGKLYINIDKVNNRKYQFHFEKHEFMDERNDSIWKPIPEEIGMTEGMFDFYEKKRGRFGALALNYYVGEFHDGFATVERQDLSGSFVDTNGDLIPPNQI